MQLQSTISARLRGEVRIDCGKRLMAFSIDVTRPKCHNDVIQGLAFI